MTDNYSPPAKRRSCRRSARASIPVRGNVGKEFLASSLKFLGGHDAGRGPVCHSARGDPAFFLPNVLDVGGVEVKLSCWLRA